MSPLTKRILQLLFLVAIQAFLLFISSGKPLWGAGWWYIGLYLGCLVLASFILMPAHKDVIEERSKGTAGAKNWDIWLTRLITIPSLGVLIVAGLDERFGWTTDFGLAGRLIGIAFFVGGYFLVIWAMLANRFFSTVVRIQSDRGHQAVTTGPYHFIRHPGYAGMLVSMLGSVLILESYWGFIPVVIYTVMVFIRLIMEDKTLQAELPGYADYMRSTRYRLIPGVW